MSRFLATFNANVRVAKNKIVSDGKGRTYVEMPSSHVPIEDMPDEFYKLMLEIAKD